MADRKDFLRMCTMFLVILTELVLEAGADRRCVLYKFLLHRLTKKLGFLAQSVARLTGDLGVTSSITRTCLYNVDPHEPHFYIVKLGFTGVYIIFLFLLKNIDCGYSLEPPRWGASNKYPQSMFWTEMWKISEFFIWKFSVFGGKIFNIFE